MLFVALNVVLLLTSAVAAAVAPRCAANIEVRLVGGQSQYQGRVEVRRAGTDDPWGTVCDHGFDDRAADVVCRCLRYGAGTVVGSKIYPADRSMNIHTDNVDCSGLEDGLAHCFFSRWVAHDCSHSEDVVVSCQPRITSRFGSTSASITSGASSSTSASTSPSASGSKSPLGSTLNSDHTSTSRSTSFSGFASNSPSTSSFGLTSNFVSASASGSTSTSGSASALSSASTIPGSKSSSCTSSASGGSMLRTSGSKSNFDPTSTAFGSKSASNSASTTPGSKLTFRSASTSRPTSNFKSTSKSLSSFYSASRSTSTSRFAPATSTSASESVSHATQTASGATVIRELSSRPDTVVAATITHATGIFYPHAQHEDTGYGITKETDAVFATVGTVLAVAVFVFVAVTLVVWTRRSTRGLSAASETKETRIGKLPTLFDDDGSDYDVIYEKEWTPPKTYYNNTALNTSSLSGKVRAQASRAKLSPGAAVTKEGTRKNYESTSAVATTSINTNSGTRSASTAGYLNTVIAANTKQGAMYYNLNELPAATGVSKELKTATGKSEKRGEGDERAKGKAAGKGDKQLGSDIVGDAVTGPGATSVNLSASAAVNVVKAEVKDEARGSENGTRAYNNLSDTSEL